jgi:hypothetical protein
MFTELGFVIIVSSTISLNNPEKIFYLDSDYSEEAHKLMIQNNHKEFFDSNDILYKAILKELQEETIE